MPTVPNITTEQAFSFALGELKKKDERLAAIKRNLLLASLAGIFFTFTGTIPTEVSALGITLSDLQQNLFVGVIAVIILYFLLAFMGMVQSILTLSGDLSGSTSEELAIGVLPSFDDRHRAGEAFVEVFLPAFAGLAAFLVVTASILLSPKDVVADAGFATVTFKSAEGKTQHIPMALQPLRDRQGREKTRPSNEAIESLFANQKLTCTFRPSEGIGKKRIDCAGVAPDEIP